MLMTKASRPATRTLRGWAISVLQEAGAIREIADLVVWYKGHSERVQLAVTSLGKQKLILGFSWLRTAGTTPRSTGRPERSR